ncbi:hypothetical protein [Nocardia sp. bgisy118]|uniref:hypothetical protein n=1 Tax=Nocardia sp. bgisy118 TaxID=3413786 RepID=UPI003F4A5242
MDTAEMDHPGHAGASNRPRRLFLAARARFAEDAVQRADPTSPSGQGSEWHWRSVTRRAAVDRSMVVSAEPIERRRIERA